MENEKMGGKEKKMKKKNENWKKDKNERKVLPNQKKESAFEIWEWNLEFSLLSLMFFLKIR